MGGGDSHSRRKTRRLDTDQLVAHPILYPALALCALVGPTWLGQTGVAEAAYRPIGIDRHDQSALLLESGASSSGRAESQPPSEPAPQPGRARVHQFDTPAHDGTCSTSPGPSPVGPGSGAAVLPEVPPPPPTLTARLVAGRAPVTPPPNLGAVFEPPRFG